MCGATENLEFDHVDHRSKTAEIAKVWTYSNKKFWAEIKKCQLLCQSCHREKTYRDLGWKKAKGVHGAPGSHRYCKCELCMKAWRDYQKAQGSHRRIRIVEISFTERVLVIVRKVEEEYRIVVRVGPRFEMKRVSVAGRSPSPVWHLPFKQT